MVLSTLSTSTSISLVWCQFFICCLSLHSHLLAPSSVPPKLEAWKLLEVLPMRGTISMYFLLLVEPLITAKGESRVLVLLGADLQYVNLVRLKYEV